MSHRCGCGSDARPRPALAAGDSLQKSHTQAASTPYDSVRMGRKWLKGLLCSARRSTAHEQADPTGPLPAPYATLRGIMRLGGITP